MKLLFSISLLIAIFVLTVEGQTLSATNQAVGTNGTFTIKERGAHHRVWERVVNETNLSGQVVQQVRRYTELASGLHYWDTNANSWKDSNERIQPVPGGAAAVQGQHQVYFPYDLYAGVIEMVTPEGQHLKSRPLCLNYFDGTNSVVFATLQSTVGQIVVQIKWSMQTRLRMTRRAKFLKRMLSILTGREASNRILCSGSSHLLQSHLA